MHRVQIEAFSQWVVRQAFTEEEAAALAIELVKLLEEITNDLNSIDPDCRRAERLLNLLIEHADAWKMETDL